MNETTNPKIPSGAFEFDGELHSIGSKWIKYAQDTNDSNDIAVAVWSALREVLDEQTPDAKRYRWLSEQHWVESEATFRLGLSGTDDATQYESELGAAIDAAIAANK